MTCRATEVLKFCIGEGKVLCHVLILKIKCSSSKTMYWPLTEVLWPALEFRDLQNRSMSSGGGPVVSSHPFYSDDPSSNPPADIKNHFLIFVLQKDKKEARVGNL